MQFKFSAGVYRILEADPETPLSFDDAMAFMAPDDRAEVEAALKAAATTGTPYRMEVPRITSRREGDRYILSVGDNGIGFDIRHHDRIFQIFQRLQRAEDFPGTGVGLALVQKAMERVGGRAWAESGPGQGAVFHLEFLHGEPNEPQPM